MKAIRWLLTIALLQNFCLAYGLAPLEVEGQERVKDVPCKSDVSSQELLTGLAPKSQANQNLLYEFNAENLLREGYALYSEPGQSKILAFFLGRYHDYYQVDIFDLTTRERVGYIDFSIRDFQDEKSAGLTTALILWQDRTYSRWAEEAAIEYGLDLKNLEAVNDFRENTPLDPRAPPAMYLRDDFTRKGKIGWRHLSDILMGISIFVAVKEKADRMTLDPELSLHDSLFYQRRFGALPQKGWYLQLYPIVYEKHGLVNLGGMMFDFENGRFLPSTNVENLPGPLDIFVDSISALNQGDLKKIDKETKGGAFPDRHVWSFLKAVSDLLGGDARERLKGWVSQSLEARGRDAIDIPLSFADMPREWEQAAWILLEKGMIKLVTDLTDLGPLPQAETWPVTRSGIFFKFVDQSA